MFFWIALAAWLAGVVLSFVRGRTVLPLVILILGIADVLGIFFLGFGWLGVSALAIMGVVIHVANKLDSV